MKNNNLIANTIKDATIRKIYTNFHIVCKKGLNINNASATTLKAMASTDFGKIYSESVKNNGIISLDDTKMALYLMQDNVIDNFTNTESDMLTKKFFYNKELVFREMSELDKLSNISIKASDSTLNWAFVLEKFCTEESMQKGELSFGDFTKQILATPYGNEEFNSVQASIAGYHTYLGQRELFTNNQETIPMMIDNELVNDNRNKGEENEVSKETISTIITKDRDNYVINEATIDTDADVASIN